MSKLRLRPWTVKRADALAFVEKVHRRLPDIQGAMWCASVRDEGEIVGVALVGWPSQEQTNDEIDMLRVLRVAVKGAPDGQPPLYPNACSMLYGACWRAARALGATSMDTHTHLDESSGSLIAAGWTFGGMTSGGEHSRETRPRKAAKDPRPKFRWWAPGSLRAPKDPPPFPGPVAARPDVAPAGSRGE